MQKMSKCVTIDKRVCCKARMTRFAAVFVREERTGEGYAGAD